MTAPPLERTSPVTDTTEGSLPDFSPQCSLAYTNPAMQFAGIPPQPCEEPAKWTGFTPCCGQSVLICEHHRWEHSPFHCGPCGQSFDTLINWARL